MIVDQIINHSDELKFFCEKIRLIERLDIIVKQNLPENCHQHFRVANLANGLLVISVATPEWRHQFRYMQSDLLDKLRSTKEGIGISSIKVITQPEFLEPEIKRVITAGPLQLSAGGAGALQDSAAGVTNPQLKQALLKLAQRISNN